MATCANVAAALTGAMAWGLSRVAVSRLNGDLASNGTAAAAAAAAIAVALAAGVYRFLGRNRMRGAAYPALP